MYGLVISCRSSGPAWLGSMRLFGGLAGGLSRRPVETGRYQEEGNGTAAGSDQYGPLGARGFAFPACPG